MRYLFHDICADKHTIWEEIYYSDFIWRRTIQFNKYVFIIIIILFVLLLFSNVIFLRVKSTGTHEESDLPDRLSKAIVEGCFMQNKTKFKIGLLMRFANPKVKKNGVTSKCNNNNNNDKFLYSAFQNWKNSQCALQTKKYMIVTN